MSPPPRTAHGRLASVAAPHPRPSPSIHGASSRPSPLYVASNAGSGWCWPWMRPRRSWTSLVEAVSGRLWPGSCLPGDAVTAPLDLALRAVPSPPAVVTGADDGDALEGRTPPLRCRRGPTPLHLGFRVKTLGPVCQTGQRRRIGAVPSLETLSYEPMSLLASHCVVGLWTTAVLLSMRARLDVVVVLGVSSPLLVQQLVSFRVFG